MKKSLVAVIAAAMTLTCATLVSAEVTTVNGNTGYFQKTGNQKATYSIQSSEVHSGEKALFLNGNDQSGDNAKYRYDLPKTSDGKWNVTFYAKILTDDWAQGIGIGGTYKTFDSGIWTKTDIGNGWKKYVGTIDAGSESTLMLRVHGWGRYYLDDLFVTDSSGNLLVHDDFEDEKVWSGWSLTKNAGGKYAKIIMDENENHMAAVTGAGGNEVAMTYALPRSYTPHWRASFTVNFPDDIDVTSSSASSRFKIGAHAQGNMHELSTRGTWTKLEDSNLQDMGPGRSWWRFEFTPGGTGGLWWDPVTSFGIRAYSGTTIYVDDFTFEVWGWGSAADYKKTENFETYYTAKDFAVNDFAAKGVVGGATLSWINPAYAPTEIKLYDGETEITATGISLSANAANSITVPVADLDEHTFKIVMNGAPFTAEATATAKAEKWEIKNFAANGAEGRVVLTWRNPDLAPTEIALYEDGMEVPTGSIKLGANEINVINVASDGTPHTYKLVAKSGDLTTEATTKGQAGVWVANAAEDVYGMPLQGWRVQKYGEHVYGGVEIVTDNVSQGKYALKVVPTVLNDDESGYVWWNNRSLQLHATTGDLKAGQTYKLTFDGKLSFGRALAVYAVWNGGQAYKEMLKTNGNYSEDWKQYELIFTQGSADGRRLTFSFDGGTEAFWLDNVKLYECDADGNVTGSKNLIVNGSFENELKDVKLENDVISWTQNETDDWDYVNVYLKKEDGSLVLYKKVTEGTSVELGAMKSAVENFVVKTVRVGGAAEYTSMGWEVSRTAEYMVGAVSYDTVEEIETGVYEKVTEDIDTIEAGLIMASVELSVGTLDKYSVDAYTALYDNGKLVKIQKASASAVKGETDTLSNIIEVPALDNGVYTIKTFVWTGGTMVSEVADAGLTE